MKTLGWLLLIGGCVWIVVAINMDTTVPAGSSGIAVHNIGLLADRLTHVILACLLLLVGAVLLGFSSLKKSGPDTSRVHRWIPLAVFVLIASLLFAGVQLSRNGNREALPSPLIGKPAPAFELPVLQETGRLVSSQELRGEPYLLNVWGSWCPECRVEHPVLTRFAESRRIRVIGYNLKDERADALAWLRQFGNPYWLVLTDYTGEKAIDWGIYGAPETFLVDADGIIRWKHVGPMSERTIREELLPKLQQVGAR